jgi:hypothetical protein
MITEGDLVLVGPEAAGTSLGGVGVDVHTDGGELRIRIVYGGTSLERVQQSGGS